MADAKNNTGYYNTGYYNTGDYNTGDYNTGYYNTGNRNTGDCNTGNYNTGYYNTGNRNTGNRNTGNRNTGDCNTGDCNTGYYNTGDYNTGDYNTGYYNTGDYNTGYYNTGNRNTGNRNTGDCNTTTPTVRMFNKDSGIEFNSPRHIQFRNALLELSKPTLEWISEINMTEKQKEENSTYKTTGGFLINHGKRIQTEVSKEQEEILRSMPNFDAEILLECTGIDLVNKKVKIVFDGKEILISKEEAENIKKQFGCK